MIRVLDFKKDYSSNIVVCPNITVKEDITILYGRNGTGKTTLLKAIAGLSSYQGEIIVSGTVSYMIEESNLPYEATVLELINGITKLYPAKEVTSLIKGLYLSEKVDSRILSLSKGMKTKLRFLITVMVDKDIYLLDEPFSGVDQDSIKWMKQYIASQNRMFLIATHLWDEFKSISKEVITL